MNSQIDWSEAARNFSVDFDELARYFPTTAEVFQGVFDDLKEVQRLNKEFYDLAYKTKLSSSSVEQLDSEAQQFRQIVGDLIKLLNRKGPRGNQHSLETRRVINEAAVRKREVRYLASQYLPYLRQEASGQKIFSEQQEELRREITDFKAKEQIGEAKEVFGESVNGYKQLARQWLIWRRVWLSSIVAVVFSITIIFIVLLFRDSFTGDWDLYKQTKWADFLALKLQAIPFVAIPVIGFLFASRNYRIYSNLEEVYLHRETSLKLLLALMSTEAYMKASGDEKIAIVREAGEALFKFRPTGHLRSKDSDGSLVSQISNSARERR